MKSNSCQYYTTSTIATLSAAILLLTLAACSHKGIKDHFPERHYTPFALESDNCVKISTENKTEKPDISIYKLKKPENLKSACDLNYESGKSKIKLEIIELADTNSAALQFSQDAGIVPPIDPWTLGMNSIRKKKDLLFYQDNILVRLHTDSNHPAAMSTMKAMAMEVYISITE